MSFTGSYTEVEPKSRTEYFGSEAQNSKSSSETAEGIFDPSVAVVSREGASNNEPHEEEFKLPSVYEETESFGPQVPEAIAQRVNDACSKKAMDSKLKDLYEKYRTPANCKYLCVPKVNLELWRDLSKESKSKDLGLQELQEGIVKASQPIIQLFDERQVFNESQCFAIFIGRRCYLSGARLISYIS